VDIVENVNLLVSSVRWAPGQAKREIIQLLRRLGDEHPVVNRTTARGLFGVRTSLDPHAVVREVRAVFKHKPLLLQHTLKWVPVDLWIRSDEESLKDAVLRLRDRVRPGERWRMTVEKRQYTRHHTVEIITMLAGLIRERVDLTKPDKILRIDLIGNDAAVSVLAPDETFSVTKPAP
jgi:tRNA(Ser,Leu) C12 N-acetylase TAN1